MARGEVAAYGRVIFSQRVGDPLSQKVDARVMGNLRAVAEDAAGCGDPLLLCGA
ncbi:MAG: hypothetical protein WDO73_26730 [Ignavibacteriota bacterium]